MPLEQVVQPPPPPKDLVFWMWPDPIGGFQNGGILNGNARGSFGSIVGAFDAGFGVGSATMLNYRFNLGAEWLQRANTMTLGCSPRIDVTVNTPTSSKPNVYIRLVEYSFLMAITLNGGGWAAQDDGWKWQPATGVSPGAPSGGTPFFGISPNAAGTQMLWQSKQSVIIGPTDEQLPFDGVSLPAWPQADLTEPVLVRLLFFSALGQTPGRIELFVNDTAMLSRSFATDPLPLYGAGFTRYVMRIASTVAGNRIWFGNLNVRYSGQALDGSLL